MGDTYSVDCQKCFATIPITDPGLIGRKIACPKCGARMRVRAPAEEEDDGEDGGLFKISEKLDGGPSPAISDEPTDVGKSSPTEIRHPEDARKRKQRKKKKPRRPVPRSEQDLSGVRTGLFLLLFQAMVWVVLFLNLAGFAFVSAFEMKISEDSVNMWLGGVLIVFLLSYVIGVSGKLFCLKAPESVGREFIVIALSLEAIAFVMGVLIGTDVLTWEYAQTTSNVVGILGSIMFLWFLSDLGLHLDREYLSDDAQHIVGLGVGAFVVYFLVLGSTFFLGLFGALFFVVPLVMIVLIFVRYMTLIVRLNAELKR